MFFIKSFWQVRKHETQSYRESCMFRFSHFELYFALHSCVLSTLQRYLLQFPTIIFFKDKFSSNWWKLIQITYCNSAKFCK